MEAESHARERRRLATAEAEARQASAALDRQLEQARQLLAERSAAERDAARRAEQAVGRARSITEALARLEREQAAQARREAERARREEEQARREAAVAARPRAVAPAPAPSRAPEPSGPGGFPVAGSLVREFNAPGEGGPARGLTFAAQPGARVTAPCSGSVAFAAPFRSYGRMVILDCGGGQHLVLSGMDRLDVSGGQRVRSGEPVGVLPSSPRPTLYMELRRRGAPVDPRPWLRAGA
nr:peptidoglycan DD-metalloendopeptidase family protein [Roseococcus pinisoli]